MMVAIKQTKFPHRFFGVGQDGKYVFMLYFIFSSYIIIYLDSKTAVYTIDPSIINQFPSLISLTGAFWIVLIPLFVLNICWSGRHACATHGGGRKRSWPLFSTIFLLYFFLFFLFFYAFCFSPT